MLTNKTKKIIDSESGLGFVESLMALLIAGIACVALISLSASIIKEAKRNEYRDAMNQYAIEGLDRVRWMNTTDPGSIPCDHTAAWNYYKIVEDGENYDLETVAERCSENWNTDNCEALKLTEDGRDFFYRDVQTECTATSDTIKITVEVGFRNPVSGMSSSNEIVGYVPKE